MTATSKEQSDRLLMCGVSSYTADMYYLVDTLHIGQVARTIGKNIHKEITFAWSLSRLLELLPTPIFYQNRRQTSMKISRAHDGNIYGIGERIAQLIIMPIPEIEFEEVEDLSDSERGIGGYGSSGL